MSANAQSKRLSTISKCVGSPSDHQSVNAHTWPDGTKKSQGNAFDWLPEKIDAPLTRLELTRKRQREYERAKYAATRVNPESHSASSCVLNSVKAAR